MPAWLAVDAILFFSSSFSILSSGSKRIASCREARLDDAATAVCCALALAAMVSHKQPNITVASKPEIGSRVAACRPSQWRAQNSGRRAGAEC